MKLIAWNVNSIVARAGLLGQLIVTEQPDVVCLSETRCTDAAFDAAVAGLDGWVWTHAAATKGRNGVAIGARSPLVDVEVEPVERGTSLAGSHPFGIEARSIAATVDGVRVVSVYAPNGREIGHPHFAYKLAWYAALRDRVAGWVAAGTPVVVAGDVNVAPADDDVWSPRRWVGRTHVTPEERAAFAEVAGEHGLLVDAWRHVHPDRVGFTWWNYRGNGFMNRHGLRIDVVGVSRDLGISACEVLEWARACDSPSDHAPVSATFTTPGRHQP